MAIARKKPKAKSKAKPNLASQALKLHRELVKDWRGAQAQLTKVLKDPKTTEVVKTRAQSIVSKLYDEVVQFRKKHGWHSE